MAEDLRIRNIPQALADTQSLTDAANQMHASKEALERATAAALAESSGEAVDQYWGLFREYMKAFQEQIDVRNRLANAVRQIIENNQEQDQRIAKSFIA